jgi:anaphase-promoting complex subunit 2
MAESVLLFILFSPDLGTEERTLYYKSIRNRYESAYARMKPDKKLRWLPQLGSVSMELELADRKIEIEVTPLQAAIIELFSEKGNPFPSFHRSRITY